jgi:hypothetical protein
METHKFKIACIVDNYSNGKKLATTFENDNIKVMPLNTKYFNNISNDIPFLLITKEEKPLHQASLTAKDNWDILLILDKNEEENQAKCLNFLESFTTDTLVMWHINAEDFLPEKTLQEIMGKGNIKKYKKGMHSSGDNNGYALLQNLVMAWDNKTEKFIPVQYDDAKKKIIEWFGVNDKLNAALQFLHECLGDTPAKLDVLTKEEFTEEDLGNKNPEGSIHNLYKNMEGKKNGEYIKELRVLRDAVLKKAGVI